MSFSIKFINGHNVDSKIQGRITLGGFSELFEPSLSFWQKEDYIKQWKEGLRRLIHGEQKSCLITSMNDPVTANFINIWPLYRDNDMVFVQNTLLFLNNIEGDLEPNAPYEHIPKRITQNESGQKISEWSITFDEVALAFSKLDLNCY